MCLSQEITEEVASSDPEEFSSSDKDPEVVSSSDKDKCFRTFI